MAGGQALDLQAAGKVTDLATLQQIHSMKTGALIEAAVLMGAHIAGVNDIGQLQHLSNYARALGLGFQIHDDILDVVSDTETLGKQTGAKAPGRPQRKPTSKRTRLWHNCRWTHKSYRCWLITL
jgi:geranylgeranyl pyrophosphate synthase